MIHRILMYLISLLLGTLIGNSTWQLALFGVLVQRNLFATKSFYTNRQFFQFHVTLGLRARSRSTSSVFGLYTEMRGAVLVLACVAVRLKTAICKLLSQFIIL